MPIYEYKCQACEIKFEVRRGFSESTGAGCPRCQRPAQRIFSPVPIVFKGPGFYVTDHASHGRSSAGAGGGDGERPGSQGDGQRPPQKASDQPAAQGKDAEKAPAAEPSGPKPAEIKA